jgi:hypothetical protein
MLRRNIVKKLALICSLMVLSLVSNTCETLAVAYQHPATGMVFTDQLAGMTKVQVTDFEKKQPGLGTSIGYNGVGVTATIYIYTAGLKSVPATLDAPLVRSHFNQVVGDVIKAGEMGYYDDVKVISENVVFLRPDQAGAKALRASFSYAQNSVDRLSNLYLLAYKNHFLKIRFTYNKSEQSQAENTLKLLLEEISKSMEEKVAAGS